MIRWKYSGESKRDSKAQYFIFVQSACNPEIAFESSSKGVCQYPENMSAVAMYILPANACKQSSTRGRENLENNDLIFWVLDVLLSLANISTARNPIEQVDANSGRYVHGSLTALVRSYAAS